MEFCTAFLNPSFRNIDRYEGVPEHYRRIELRVTAADGREMGAQVYIASKVEKGLKPTPHYLKSILDGAAEHGMPDDYVAAVRARSRRARSIVGKLIFVL